MLARRGLAVGNVCTAALAAAASPASAAVEEIDDPYDDEFRWAAGPLTPGTTYTGTVGGGDEQDWVYFWQLPASNAALTLTSAGCELTVERYKRGWVDDDSPFPPE